MWKGFFLDKKDPIRHIQINPLRGILTMLINKAIKGSTCLYQTPVYLPLLNQGLRRGRMCLVTHARDVTLYSSDGIALQREDLAIRQWDVSCGYFSCVLNMFVH